MLHKQAVRGVFMFDVETEKPEHKPDNSVIMEINGTEYIIHEFFGGKESINDIIAKRIKRELGPTIPT